VACLCELYLGICLTTEEKERKNFSQVNKNFLTHCGRVTLICVFNMVKLGTSASSP
jgi:hypothetical protein